MMQIDFLPLKSYVNIVEGNALRMDWNDVVPASELNYIMGNPPFIGYSLQTTDQKQDILSIYIDKKGKTYKSAGKIDYVSGWFFKAAELMQGTEIRTALVSTNSITQGEQVAGVWKPLYDRFCIHIDFAHRTFRWDSEASIKAHVHCVIVGFSIAPNTKQKQLYLAERVQLVDNINAYLIDAPNVFIESKTKALCDVPQMVYGNKPTDGGHLFLTAEERDELFINDPVAFKYVRQIYGASEYINTQEWGLTSTDKVISKINQNLHFFLGNGLYMEEFKEFKTTIRNLMSTLVYKYSVQTKKNGEYEEKSVSNK